MEWAKISGGSLLSFALEHLSLGRAHLLQSRQEGSNDFTQARTHLNQAIDGLRKVGRQDYIPRSLLARAELHRVRGDLQDAQHDLDKAMSIAECGEMGLHQVDCHLEYVQLSLAMGDKDKAREHLFTIREMTGKMEYHQRDGEVEEQEAKL